MSRERMKDEELEATLSDIGARLAYPRPTRLAAAVRARLAGEPRREHWWEALRSPRYALAPALTTLALLLLVVVAAGTPAVLEATEFLRVRGIDIFRAPAITAPPTSGAARFTGERVTIDAARSRVPFLRVPSDARLGSPDAVYVERAQSGDRVTLVYTSRSGIPASREAGVSALVVEFRGSVDESFFGKVAGPGTQIEEVRVNGNRGFWLEGEPHLFFYRDEAGNIWNETLRLAGNTLLWEQDGTTLRIEAQVSKDEALRLAASLR